MIKADFFDRFALTFHQLSLSQLDLGVIWLNEKGRVIWVNNQYTLLSGFDLSEITQLSIFEINPTLNLLSWRKFWKRLKESSSDQFETQHISQTGKLYPVQVEARSYSIEDQFFCCKIIRVSNQNNSHLELLQSLTQVLQICVWNWDLLTNNFTITPDFQTLFPVPSSTFASHTSLMGMLSPICKKEDIELLQSCLKKVTTTEKSFKLDLFIPSLTQWLHISGEAIKKNEKVIQLRGTIQDKTTQKLGESHLEIAKFALDNASNMVIWTNEKADLLYFNKTVISTLGYSRKELAQMKIYDINKQFDKVNWKKYWANLKENKSIVFEGQHYHKDGQIIPVKISTNYVELNGQEFSCGIIQDITEWKRKEVELATAYQELRIIKEQFELENIYLKEEIRQDHDFNEIISQSDNYTEVLSQIQQVAATDATVLITGETGTGKELLVRALHRISTRANKSLIKINCAVLPPNLIESELFGHEKGAFTGAIQKKIGRFELAHEGTIFLDEIGELPLDLQAKLLRVLQEGEFERLGGTKTISVNTRVIAATNRNLPEQIRKNKFREDLFYRLNVFPIHNIPLRERREDIPLLIHFFMRKYGERLGRKFLKINPSFLESLMKYDFPGNIRELENFIERAVIISTPPELKLENWAEEQENKPFYNGFKTFDQMQYDHIMKALRQANWKVSGKFGAAELLDLNPKTLESKMRKLKISRRDFIDD